MEDQICAHLRPPVSTVHAFNGLARIVARARSAIGSNPRVRSRNGRPTADVILARNACLDRLRGLVDCHLKIVHALAQLIVAFAQRNLNRCRGRRSDCGRWCRGRRRRNRRTVDAEAHVNLVEHLKLLTSHLEVFLQLEVPVGEFLTRLVVLVQLFEFASQCAVGGRQLVIGLLGQSGRIIYTNA